MITVAVPPIPPRVSVPHIVVIILVSVRSSESPVTPNAGALPIILQFHPNKVAAAARAVAAQEHDKAHDGDPHGFVASLRRC